MKLLRPLSPERLALYVAMALVLLFNLPFWQRLWEIVSPLDGHGVKMLALALALTTTFFTGCCCCLSGHGWASR